jgi:hypothetical protein
VTHRAPPYISGFVFRVRSAPKIEGVGDQKDALKARWGEGDIMSSKYFKLLVACAALIGLVAFVFLIDFSDEADSSAYGPNAGAPVVHGSAPGQ